MQRLLGVTPPDDRRGCLQDIHWPSGAFGYFPTYTMGAIAASQIFAAATKADPTIVNALAEGRFAPLFGFLRPKVHARGASVTVDELLTDLTGAPLDPQVFLAHLRRRYLEDQALARAFAGRASPESDDRGGRRARACSSARAGASPYLLIFSPFAVSGPSTLVSSMAEPVK
jgi:hypothetical protein